MSSTDPLLQPFTLKGVTFRNRILSTAHAPGYVKDGHPQLRYQLYHEEKAKGGIALTMFGGSSTISADTPSVFGQINAGDDSVIPHLKALADRVHRHGAKAMCQITHLGRRTTWNDGDWLPVIAPSRVREPAHRGFPKAMDHSDIARTVKAFGAAARRVKESGLDGVELIAHAHLIEQFWTPRVNKRTDGYGGSLKNRMRFSFEVIEEVRGQVGEDFIVGVRMGSESTLEDDLTLDENLQIAQALEALGSVDFLNINRGQVESDAHLAHMMPGMADPLAVHLAILKPFRDAVKVPLFHAGRINDIATARHAIRSGVVDMIGMTRAHMADPHIVNKLMRGDEERIRPCVGAGYCLDTLFGIGQAYCVHNPSTGREANMPHVIEKTIAAKKRVVVVGAGPAGMEAARVSAERGHHVVLYEAGAQLGGQLNLASRNTWRGDMAGVSRWLEGELEHLGVTIKTNHLIESTEIHAEAADIVVVATGGVPDPLINEGAELIVSVWDVLSGSLTLSGSVLVFDDNGQAQAPSCAQYLAENGCEVEIVTPDRMIGAEMGSLNFPIFLERFYAHGVTMTPDQRLRGVSRDGNRLKATLINEYTNKETIRSVDHVVVEHGTLPVEALYQDLVGQSSNQGITDQESLLNGQPQPLGEHDGAFQLFRVGDAVASRNIHAAIYDSLRLCKNF